MTYEEKVRWLRRYQESLRREQELAEEVERLQSEATRITPLLSAMPGGPGGGQKVPRSVERILQAKQELLIQINNCSDVRQQIDIVVSKIDGDTEQEILRRRYLLGQTWEKISDSMSYSLRNIYLIHKKAIEKVKII